MSKLLNLQDVVRCKLCEDPNPVLYCALCHIDICKTCVGEHLLNDSKKHTVIPIKQRRSTFHYPTCPKHSTKQCELHCEKCDIPICGQCVYSEEHSEHKAKDLMMIFRSKIETIQKDVQELKPFIFHKYQEMADSVKAQKTTLDEKSKELLNVISKHGDDWHREIDRVTLSELKKVDVMRIKCMHVLDKEETGIMDQISKMKQYMSDLKELLDYNDVYKISSFQSRIAEFRRLPLEVFIDFSTFPSQKIDTEQLRKQFGALSEFSIEKQNKTGFLKMSISPSDRNLHTRWTKTS